MQANLRSRPTHLHRAKQSRNNSAQPSQRANRGGLPLFVIGFAAVTTANSLGLIPKPVTTGAVSLSSWLMVIDISALGVKTNLMAMLELGWRHVAVVVVETLFLLAMAFIALKSGFVMETLSHASI
ncbi:putative sulfate exporter family transporter [Hoeflea sp. WL0058]|uniref:Sulfate exporter family transporter n=1 Tax=Flavimaribacter sediminis TaxID=2865987 RepID=A0AAE2ZTH9_9HYPH|nr:putative sulfate exporter family transporter [Flavimaribacter sediminis]MBW8640285.1 putative sulfate exporter family transporter [Flavimaribacter sediminis]